MAAMSWDLIGKTLNYGIAFIISVILARMLEPSDFGLIALIMVYVLITDVLSDAGLGSALIQRTKVLPIHYTSVFYFNVLLGLAFAIIVYLSAPFTAAFYQKAELESIARALSIVFFLSGLSSIQKVKLRKDLKHKVLMVVNISSSILSGVVGIYLAFNGNGVWSLVTQQIVLFFSSTTLLWLLSGWLPTFNFSYRALKSLWGFGLNMFFSRLIDVIYRRLDYIIIGKVFDSSTLGLYHRARSLNQMAVNYSSGSLMSVMFPVLSSLKNDIGRFQSYVLKTLGVICFLIFLVFGNLFLISEELIVLIYGIRWEQSSVYFEILVLSTFIYPVNSLLVNILSSLGKSGLFLKLDIYKKAVALTNIVVGFQFGIEAFLIGLIFVAAIGTSMNIAVASKEISLEKRHFYKPIFEQLFATVIAISITCFLVTPLQLNLLSLLFIKLVLFSITYLLVNWFLKLSSYIQFITQFKSFIYNFKNGIS